MSKGSDFRPITAYVSVVLKYVFVSRCFVLVVWLCARRWIIRTSASRDTHVTAIWISVFPSSIFNNFFRLSSLSEKKIKMHFEFRLKLSIEKLFYLKVWNNPIKNRGSYATLCSAARIYSFPMTNMNLILRYIHGVPQHIRPLIGCDRGQKTKPKIILAKFCPSLSLGRIRFQRFA